MVIDFLQFVAQFLIALTMLRLAQAKLKDNEWGKALAFLG